MASMTFSKRIARIGIVVLIVVLNAWSNPLGRASEASAGSTPDAGSAGFSESLALEDVLEVVDPAWAANDPVTDASAPPSRDWLKNLVGPGGRTDPGAPSP